MNEAWAHVALDKVCSVITDGSHFSPSTVPEGIPYVTVRDVRDGQVDLAGAQRISPVSFEELARNGCQPSIGDVLFSKDGTVGRVALVTTDIPFVVLSSLAILRPDRKCILSPYLTYALQSPQFQEAATGQKTGLAIKRVVLKNLRQMTVPVPPLPVQRRIVDLMAHLDNHIANLRAERDGLKEALTIACLEFTAERQGVPLSPIGDVAEILDRLRVPISEKVRAGRTGNVPYFGANGQVGWIDEVIFDEPLVLLAEDGGPVAEWRTRPQAYAVDGPCWVNNHAHVLRATAVPRDWLYFSLRHRDLTALAPVGTRSKLTQASLKQIQISLPDDLEAKSEQLRAMEDSVSTLEGEIAACRSLRSAVLGAVLSRELAIPDAYDSLLPEVA